MYTRILRGFIQTRLEEKPAEKKASDCVLTFKKCNRKKNTRTVPNC